MQGLFASDESLSSFPKVTEESKKKAQALCEQARLHLEKGDPIRALDLSRQALQSVPDCFPAHMLLSRVALVGEPYLDLLARIHKQCRPRAYLEIGVASGQSLLLAGSETLAIGVDPAPGIRGPLPPWIRVFRETSDEFFARRDLAAEFAGRPLDMAFIDGMHLFEFALRDFINIERNSTPGTVILVHDCYPLDEVTSARERVTEFWTGDVWKLIACLKKYRRDLEIHTASAPPSGLGVIRRLDRSSTTLTANMGAILAEFIPMSHSVLELEKPAALNLVSGDWATVQRILSPFSLQDVLRIAAEHHEAGRLPEAEHFYRQALALDRGQAIAHYNLGIALQELERLEEAERSYAQAVALKPEFAEAHYNRGNVLKALGRLHEAERCYSQSIALKPEFAQAHNNRGTVLADLGRSAEAEQSYRRALALNPDHALALNNLGNVLRELGRLEEAERCYRQGLALRPELAQLHNHLGNALRDLGRLTEAERSYRLALSIPQANYNLLFLMNYIPGRSAAEIYDEHVEFARRFATATEPPAHRNARVPERRLRVGYVSGDLRDHAVAYFVGPVLGKHNRHDFEIYCYYNYPRADAVTARLKSHADHWRDVPALGDEALADLVREDQIDVLVDLSGHTSHNRLLMFARKPAPVQVTWLGYLNTTGLEAVDYRITDPRASPNGMFDAYHTERLIRLPDSQWCYQPPADCPEVTPSPYARSGSVTFAAFTTPPKIGDALIELWSRLLERVPGSRLLLVTGILSSIPKDYAARFARAGIPPERTELHGSKSFKSYLAMHGSADLMLDTHPYSGGTTTCHSLWMGVPVVTLGGDTPTSRGGASLLHAAGLDELIAYSSEEYLGIAAGLARDPVRLAALRASLRERMRASSLMDAERFTRNLEAAFRTMWRSWCGSRTA